MIDITLFWMVDSASSSRFMFHKSPPLTTIPSSLNLSESFPNQLDVLLLSEVRVTRSIGHFDNLRRDGFSDSILPHQLLKPTFRFSQHATNRGLSNGSCVLGQAGKLLQSHTDIINALTSKSGLDDILVAWTQCYEVTFEPEELSD